jgi:hypothetical protein
MMAAELTHNPVQFYTATTRHYQTGMTSKFPLVPFIEEYSMLEWVNDLMRVRFIPSRGSIGRRCIIPSGYIGGIGVSSYSILATMD